MGEMVKRRVVQGFIFHGIIPAHHTFCWKFFYGVKEPVMFRSGINKQKRIFYINFLRGDTALKMLYEKYTATYTDFI